MEEYRLTSETKDRRTGIKTIVNWHQDYKVTASYYRRDGSFIKAEALGYAQTEKAFKRLAERYILDQGL